MINFSSDGFSFDSGCVRIIRANYYHLSSSGLHVAQSKYIELFRQLLATNATCFLLATSAPQSTA